MGFGMQWYVIAYNVLIDLLRNPSTVIAIVAFIGLVLQRKTINEIISGTLRAFLSVIILIIGATAVVNALAGLDTIFGYAYGFRGIYEYEEVAIGYAMARLGAEIGGILGLGFFIHLIIVRIIPTKYKAFKQVFLTGHHLWLYAGFLALILYGAGITGWQAIIIGGIMAGITYTIVQAAVWPFIEKVTDGRWGFAHGQWFGIIIAGLTAKYLGNPEQDTEKIKLPASIEFLKQPALIAAIIMVIVWIVAVLSVPAEWFYETFDPGMNRFVWAIIQGMWFGAGVEVILTGVRMLIGEILPAFKGISDKLIPESIPGLDCPTIYPLAPVSLMLGVLIMSIMSIVWTFVQISLGLSVVVLPSAIVMFFVGASTGVVANKHGGLRGVIIASIVASIYWMWGPLLSWYIYPYEALNLPSIAMWFDPMILLWWLLLRPFAIS